MALKILQDAKDHGVTIHIIHDGHDTSNPSGHDVWWDPNSALRLPNGELQSAAMGLLHELAHTLIDPSVPVTWDPLFLNTLEADVILHYENPAAAQLGEPDRMNHDGTAETVTDPTQHTPG